MNNEKREQQMMTAAEAYAEEVGYKDEHDLCATLNVFCAGWRAADNSRWIPVEKELPKEKQKVLVYMPADERCDHEYMCEALYNYAWHKWEDADEPIELEGITHWMPLPVPPQGKEE